MSEDFWCFPEATEFKIQYTELMKDDNYLAKKTMPTMIQ